MKTTEFKNCRVVRSSWLEEGGRRLDCNPYMSGALEARDALRKLHCRKDKLVEVTLEMFDSGRASRTWVDDPMYGVRYMGSTAISLGDLSTLPLISKKQTKRNQKLLIKSGWSLITRSGTIGRMAYARPDMDGLACSEDVLRVVPNSDIIPSGYLYAFLSSRFGVPLVVAGTYGAIIQHIEPSHIADLPVPRLGSDVEQRTHLFVQRAASARAEAFVLRRNARELLNVSLGFPEKLSFKSRDLSTASTNSSAVLSRMDATFHDSFAQRSDSFIGKTNAVSTLHELGITSAETGRLKQVFTEPEFGVPFYTSGEIFKSRLDATRFLSRNLLKLNEDVLVKTGEILIARSGQVGGIIGRGVWADSRFEKSCVSVDVLRLSARESEIPAGYVFAFLCLTDIGYRQLIRGASGSSIPHLNANDVLGVKLPRCERKVESDIASLVEKSGELLAQANDDENQAWGLIEGAIERNLNG